jgi:hypothetical protein
MISTKGCLLKMLDTYEKEGHSIEEIIGFMAGVQRTMILMDKIAQNK